MSILITTENQLKVDCVKSIFGDQSQYLTKKFDGSVQQPYGIINGVRHSLLCAIERTEQAIEYIENEKIAGVEKIVSMENGIVTLSIADSNIHYDVCDSVIYDVKTKFYYTTLHVKEIGLLPVPIPDDIFQEAMQRKITCGEVFAEKYECDKGNWMKMFGVDRKAQITMSLEKAMLLINTDDYCSVVPDFPKKGIMFKDYNRVYYKGSTHLLADQMVNMIGNIFKFSLPRSLVVAGPELRGCMLAAIVASAMRVPSILIRKPGKLPPPINTEKYSTEYSNDTLQIVSNLNFAPGTVCIVIDDVIATGGSLNACVKLCRSIGLEVTDTIVIDSIDTCVRIHLDFNVHLLM